MASIDGDGNDGVNRRGLVTFCSWNVNGIDEPIKRGKVLAYRKSLRSDVIFYQETHLKNDAHCRITAKWIGQVYHSRFSAKARGTAIIICKNVPFIHKSTLADKEGRYIMVVGEIQSIPITLLNVYGPNRDDPEFFRKMFSLILDISTTNLILGGDFNLVLDTYLDRSSAQRIAPSNASRFLKSFIDNLGLVDVWRTLNATGREYSFHSGVHNTYSRIDYFLLDSKLLHGVQSSKYHNILISAHSLVSISLNLLESGGNYKHWRLDPQLLTRKTFCNYLEEQIKLFFEMNDKDDVSPLLLWETFKAYARGCVISFQSSEKKT